jgi:hypothetical protein
MARARHELHVLGPEVGRGRLLDVGRVGPGGGLHALADRDAPCDERRAAEPDGREE